MSRAHQRGQSALELCVMLGVVILAIIGLQFYVRYAAAGRLKSSADSLSQTLLNPHKSDVRLEVNRVGHDSTTGSATRAGTGAGQTVSTTAVGGDTTLRTDLNL